MYQMAKGGRDSNGPAPAIPRLGVGPYQWDTECLHGDGEAGQATAFPQAIGLAATFSHSMLFDVSEAISKEVRAKHSDYVKNNQFGTHKGLSCFTPVINIMRDPLWGRNQETYGEDPYLAGQLSASFVKGLQGNHPRYVRANAGCKHFDAHGGPENYPVSRFSFDAKVSERDLRTTYFPAFRTCVKAGTMNIMCSYNRLNGVPACANKFLLTDVLRKEWGFKGYVVSDQMAVINVMTKHKYTHTREDTVAACVNAGCNLELSNNKFNPVYMSLVKAVKDGKIKESVVRDRAKELFYVRMRLGEFDSPSMNPYTQIPLSIVESQAHQDIAIKAALQSFVLLKNNKVLPLPKTKFNNIAVVGPFANNIKQIMGDYPPETQHKFIITPLQGLKALSKSTQTSDGCSDPACQSYDSSSLKPVVQNAEVVFVCLGTGVALEREFVDRKDLELAGNQLQLLQDTVTNAPASAKIVLLIFSASPLNVQWAEQSPRVGAIIQAFFPAQATGEALRRVLTNDGPGTSFGGRLPYTWYSKGSDVPSIVDYSMQGRTYRYFNGTPAYPYGYGLSYANFHYKGFNIPATVRAGHDVHGSVLVANTADVDGEEVVQVYISWVQTTTPAPQRQLVWFDRVSIAANSQVTFNFTITAEQQALWIDNIGWKVESGKIMVSVGGQQPNQKKSVGSNVQKGHFTVHGAQLLGIY
ncbi:hypothetical protein LOTGIDRAFT_228908 [Lottia gigantea]|uniref:Fibronectin type III-like domain-containing protein n=1 Tax=Lottia gigantea TaxID=225164 RepID=V4BK55_LOTGI|nr:hypothetical protein LOTGIDRAFT_228908 [Lottia gigantea]ESO88939.1 hypothetical protein LOTGIDRAFT_228908 [Lottia gigantea]